MVKRCENCDLCYDDQTELTEITKYVEVYNDETKDMLDSKAGIVMEGDIKKFISLKIGQVTCQNLFIGGNILNNLEYDTYNICEFCKRLFLTETIKVEEFPIHRLLYRSMYIYPNVMFYDSTDYLTCRECSRSRFLIPQEDYIRVIYDDIIRRVDIACNNFYTKYESNTEDDLCFISHLELIDKLKKDEKCKSCFHDYLNKHGLKPKEWKERDLTLIGTCKVCEKKSLNTIYGYENMTEVYPNNPRANMYCGYGSRHDTSSFDFVKEKLEISFVNDDLICDDCIDKMLENGSLINIGEGDVWYLSNPNVKTCEIVPGTKYSDILTEYNNDYWVSCTKAAVKLGDIRKINGIVSSSVSIFWNNEVDIGKKPSNLNNNIQDFMRFITMPVDKVYKIWNHLINGVIYKYTPEGNYAVEDLANDIKIQLEQSRAIFFEKWDHEYNSLII